MRFFVYEKVKNMKVQERYAGRFEVFFFPDHVTPEAGDEPLVEVSLSFIEEMTL